ncbi:MULTISPECIES: hypothetical protein [Pseudomonas]|uniref:Uncharacterized protein n=1 Tax=Pseudomonas monteilii TaxID=76759 RepID=A0A399M6B0_9PSED|nr:MULTISPECIES: hypothetical protein [Pseudomonas]MCO7058649.1 hypothetical protein [Pseudomonas juntendi]RII77324.1 hypothetical protein D0894_11965 [Pseudomonas monteilii]UJM14931.1 hypothetical protein L1P09_12490 [Pseudomonas juntendi]UXA36431.1 hypothetical protein KZA81_12805 [Pseudomonas juntendi]
MANPVMKHFFDHAVDPLELKRDLPSEVIQAQGIDWGVMVDAYLFNAARVGQSYAAHVYSDQSNVNSNGMTVATPPLVLVETRAGFKLMRSLSGNDHYVIASELGEPR